MWAPPPAEGLGNAWPIYCGVPFPKGSLTDIRNARVVDGAGRPVAAQLRVMATWPGTDSVRWLGVDFAGDPAGQYFLEFGPNVSLPSSVPGAPRIAVEQEGDAYVVSTGPARFVVPSAGPLISRAWLGNRLVLDAEGGDLYVVDNQGREGWAGRDADEPDDVRLEPGLEELVAQGAPLRATVRREGWYSTAEGERLGRHITRLHFFANQPFVHVEHTFVVTEDTSETWFRDIGVRFAHALPDAREVSFPASDPFHGEQNPEIVARPGAPYAGETAQLQLGEGERAFMFQEKAFYFSQMDPEEDCRFVIGRETGDGAEVVHEGNLAGDWADMRGPNGGLAVSIRRLWQQFPKEIEVSPDAVTARFWSDRGGMELDFRLETLLERWPKDWLDHDLHGDYGNAYQRLMRADTDATGVARTHDLLLFLHDGGAPYEDIAKQSHVFSRPVLAYADPQWLYASEAMGPIFPRDPDRFPLEESFMETYFDRHMEVIRTWGDYGFMDYGSGPHVWYRSPYIGRHSRSPEDHPFHGRWYPYLNRYSGQAAYGFHTHLWRMFARSGQRKYLDYAEETNRHRMDFQMIHWGPDANYATDHGWMIGKYKGAFSATSQPVYWTNRPTLHFNSGTDIRTLYWYYYLRDYRRAHDVAESYRELVKKLWENNPGGGPFRGTRPFATFKNLATVYQETGDPVLLEMGRSQMEWLADLESPQGVRRWPRGMGKYGTKISAIERWVEATGDELAEKALLRGAETYARTSMGNRPFTYYNAFARVLNRAYRITGDLLYPKTLKRNMDLAVALYRDHDAGEWRTFYGVTAGASGSAYPLGDMAKGMDAIVRAGERLHPAPVLQQTNQGRPVVAVIRKDAGEEAVLDVRGRNPLHPKVFTLDGSPVTTAEAVPFVRQLYSMEPAEQPRFFKVRVPADAPAGEYVLDPGSGGSPWELFATNAPRAVLFAPGGVSLGPTSTSVPLRWRFLVPEGVNRFQLFASNPVEVFAPGGSAVRPDVVNGNLSSFAVLPGAAGKLWQFAAREEAFVELRGVPPVLAAGRDEWFFLPDTARIPAERFGMERDYRALEGVDVYGGEEGFFAPGAILGERPGQGLALRGNRRLVLPRGEEVAEGRFKHFNPNEGVLEFWFRPAWSSVYRPRGASAEKYVLFTDSWFARIHDRGSLSSLWQVSGERGRLQSRAGMTFERGRWTHLAWQWYFDEDTFVLETFVDGRLADVSEANNFKPQPPGENLIIGSHRSPRLGSPLDGVVDQLRISGAHRYDADFEPSREAPLQPDAETLALFRFDGRLEGTTAAGALVPAELVE